MRLIEAAALIASAVQERGEVASVDYELVSDRTSVRCCVNFAAGPPFDVMIELSAPASEGYRDILSKVLAPSLAVH